jgi:hypothetical protein
MCLAEGSDDARRPTPLAANFFRSDNILPSPKSHDAQLEFVVPATAINRPTT